MKKIACSVLLVSALLVMNSCKDNKTSDNQNDGTTQGATSHPETDANAGAAPKTYTISVSPDSALLGKNQEAVVKIKNVKAVQLSSPDDANTGIQVTYEIEVTNKNSVGGSSVYINPHDFRLVLDNGTKLTNDTYNTVSADADATASSTGNIFKLPAGTKPQSLILFFDDTRATLSMQMQ